MSNQKRRVCHSRSWARIRPSFSLSPWCPNSGLWAWPITLHRYYSKKKCISKNYSRALSMLVAFWKYSWLRIISIFPETFFFFHTNLRTYLANLAVECTGTGKNNIPWESPLHMWEEKNYGFHGNPLLVSITKHIPTGIPSTHGRTNKLWYPWESPFSVHNKAYSHRNPLYTWEKK